MAAQLGTMPVESRRTRDQLMIERRKVETLVTAVDHGVWFGKALQGAVSSFFLFLF